MKSFRYSFLTLIVTGLVLFLIGCQEAEEVGDDDWIEDDSNPIQEETKELTLRYMFYSGFEDDYNGDKLKEIFDRIKMEQGFTIQSESKSSDGYSAILADNISRGEMPHIIEFHATLPEDINFMHEHTDHLLDLTDFLEDSGLIEEFHSLDHFTVDDRVYGLPVYSGGLTHLYYNKELVEELGGVPETLDEFIAMMKEAKQAGYNPIILDNQGDNSFSQLPYDLFQGILLETAGKEKIEALMNGEAKWTDDEFLKALQLMEDIANIDITRFDMYPDGLFNEFISGNTLFMYYNFPPDDAETFGIMQFPTASETKRDSTMMTGTFPFGYVFNGDVTEEEEKMIYQFIESFWSKEILTEYYLEEYLVPAVRVDANTDNSLLNESITLLNETHDIIPGVAELVPDVKDLPSEFGTAVSSQEQYSWKLTEIVNELLEGSITAQEAAQEIDVYHEDFLKSAN
ncbi:ABC-type glycerol-3-phosphate transport system substrate-binding protein [Gracilibacillus halotolerans]|uniref:ABC-type glycerol-3-phosphate transport system substrate-binding protein n=1 Tax=Gracilibacillus halotolerans TaxID=74386 RepID=A0A841RV50_9BACI|nr:extracellular solute-binding protein [Gracilibacillus halotolerans]MBB6514338.1 ABC-type glycerol-3-phosphate transport system substrate-binding protein [Gracilibacillus halotolerans]